MSSHTLTDGHQPRSVILNNNFHIRSTAKPQAGSIKTLLAPVVIIMAYGVDSSKLQNLHISKVGVSPVNHLAMYRTLRSKPGICPFHYPRCFSPEKVGLIRYEAPQSS